MPDDDDDQAEPDFEEVVAALLKVDPTGISGKATKKAEKADEDEQVGVLAVLVALVVVFFAVRETRRLWSGTFDGMKAKKARKAEDDKGA